MQLKYPTGPTSFNPRKSQYRVYGSSEASHRQTHIQCITATSTIIELNRSRKWRIPSQTPSSYPAASCFQIGYPRYLLPPPKKPQHSSNTFETGSNGRTNVQKNHPDPLQPAYEKWSSGGWGSILTGNVQVDINHLGSPFDPALHGEYSSAESNTEVLARWKTYACSSQKHGTPTLVQLCHPGRQSFRVAGKRGIFASSVAPSAVPISVGDSWIEKIIAALAWSKPREMTTAEVETTIARFVDAARLMADAGFAGIELHGAHGYLIDQFLSGKTNNRTDIYGGTPQKRARFILEIIRQTRAVVPPKFAIGIKLNSADHDSSTFEETMTQIALLVDAGIDFMEVSGGTYEDPRMMGYGGGKIERGGGAKSERTAAREAFFLSFAHEVRARHPDLCLMLTGGFRSRAGAVAAINDGACDLIGIGRPAAINPSLPHLLLDEGVEECNAVLRLEKVPMPWYVGFLPRNLVGAGAESTYYALQIQRFAKGLATCLPGL
ncbi:Aldolase-type TIM barrel [Penicillium argentinense]|uniref:Aldolase-type TIM barrel n=1 Tax=Penicillium argentinense TaxID=1131581 RepID=A0A9W9FN55_9EURO|nr:Aldolase-type TIM barrel [Penicillium argentinense]KAJ5102980.1 Aldolase-type TIM barrel [Penicillium argentinense]